MPKTLAAHSMRRRSALRRMMMVLVLLARAESGGIERYLRPTRLFRWHFAAVEEKGAEYDDTDDEDADDFDTTEAQVNSAGGMTDRRTLSQGATAAAALESMLPYAPGGRRASPKASATGGAVGDMTMLMMMQQQQSEQREDERRRREEERQVRDEERHAAARTEFLQTLATVGSAVATAFVASRKDD
jgi:hypothetical protein